MDVSLAALAWRRDALVCGLRIADGIRVLLGEEGHSDADLLLILSDDRPQNGNEILFFLGILLVGYVPTELADEIDVVHEAGSPSKGHLLIRRRRGEYRNVCMVLNRGSRPLATAGCAIHGACTLPTPLEKQGLTAVGGGRSLWAEEEEH